MERSVKGLLGGGLRPNDARRFLIEAMIGAMNADGVVDPRESAAVERQIATHPAVPGPRRRRRAHADRSVQRRDPVRRQRVRPRPGDRQGPAGADPPARRVRHGRRGRGRRRAAGRRRAPLPRGAANRAADRAARVRGAGRERPRGARSPSTSTIATTGIKSLVPVACEVFALRALGRGMANDEQRFRIRDFFAAIPDLALPRDELDWRALPGVSQAARARRAGVRRARRGSPRRCPIRSIATG